MRILIDGIGTFYPPAGGSGHAVLGVVRGSEEEGADGPITSGAHGPRALT